MTKALLDDVSSMVDESQYSHHGRCSVGKYSTVVFLAFKQTLKSIMHTIY